MILNFNKINSITPHLEQRAMSTLDIDVELSEEKAEKLFYKLWSEFGDHSFKQWVKAEGFELIKKE